MKQVKDREWSNSFVQRKRVEALSPKVEALDSSLMKQVKHLDKWRRVRKLLQ